MEMPPLSPTKDGEYWVQDVVVLNKHGLHARPSAKIFEKILMPHGEDLELHFSINGGECLQIRSVFDLMSLGLEQGSQIGLKLRYHGQTDDPSEMEQRLLTDIRDLFLSFCDD